jgi:hypothetical protein
MPDTRIAWTFKPTGGTRRRGTRVLITEQVAALAHVPLFSDLSKRQLRKLADVSAVVSFSGGKEIVKQDVAGSVFYVILEGKAKVTKRGRTVKHLGPGAFFGELAIIVGAPRTASVVSETPMTLRDVVVEELPERPDLGARPRAEGAGAHRAAPDRAGAPARRVTPQRSDHG